MKTDYEYLRFVQKASKPKTSVWSCMNKHHEQELGEIKWYGPWRQYCYFPIIQAVYSKGCLDDISDFISTLKQKGSPNEDQTR